MKTNALKIALFLIGLQLSSIVSFSQSSDSLYCAPIKNIRKLTAIAIRVPVLDSLVAAQMTEINRLGNVIHGQENVLRVRAGQISNLTDEKNSYSGLYDIQIKLTDQEKKEKRQWKGIAIVLGVLTVVQVFY